MGVTFVNLIFYIIGFSLNTFTNTPNFSDVLSCPVRILEPFFFILEEEAKGIQITRYRCIFPPSVSGIKATKKKTQINSLLQRSWMICFFLCCLLCKCLLLVYIFDKMGLTSSARLDVYGSSVWLRGTNLSSWCGG